MFFHLLSNTFGFFLTEKSSIMSEENKNYTWLFWKYFKIYQLWIDTPKHLIIIILTPFA